jgi:hypothetical protein
MESDLGEPALERPAKEQEKMSELFDLKTPNLNE